MAKFTTPEEKRLRQLVQELSECLESLLDVARFATNSKEREIHLRAEAAIAKAREESAVNRG